MTLVFGLPKCETIYILENIKSGKNGNFKFWKV